MATTVTFRDPQGRTQFMGISGTVYTVSTTGVFTINQGDVVSALNAGMSSVTAVTANLTANSSANQTNATPLNTGWNQVATAAGAGYGVLLPLSYPGESVTVQNDTANTLGLFATTGDTVAGVAASTGITLPANSVTELICSVQGNWRVKAENAAPTWPPVQFVTAAGANQAAATPVAASLVIANSVPAANDGVFLPVITAGMGSIKVQNLTANALLVYPGVNDLIFNGAANASVSIAANAAQTFTPANAGPGTWLKV